MNEWFLKMISGLCLWKLDMHHFSALVESQKVRKYIFLRTIVTKKLTHIMKIGS